VAGFGGADGRPNQGAGDMLPDLVAELVQYVSRLDRPAVIGHSMGGLIGLEAAARKPVASDRAVVAKAMYEVAVTDARPRLPQIKTRTTVLYAFDSTMGIPQATVDSLYASAYQGLAGVDLQRVDGSYHFIMLDQPDAFSAEVDVFLK
jgi:pimeloyl-ACP methyl ester carboxylesterase